MIGFRQGLARTGLAFLGFGFLLRPAAVPSVAAQAAAPKPAGMQAPGFYRAKVGDFTVVALNDGVIQYHTAQLLPGADTARIRTALFDAGLADPFPMSYNAFLIDTGGKVVLIDTGTGGKLADSPFFAGAGRLAANLVAAGYRPEQIDEIYITHMGPDHVGGLADGKRRLFPNAKVRASKPEMDAAVFGVDSAGKPNGLKSTFWRDLFQPYLDAGKFEAFGRDTVLVPGIRAIGTHGHTAGHTSYLVESGGGRLLVLGDLVLAGFIQLADPGVLSSFDADQPAAAAQRRRILELAARNDYLVAAAHLSFPGLGHVRGGPGGYRWAPLDYALPDR
jgi:glyoxylase-like metal-dependent hydrolase (beta-lactamase superfamily II)